MDTITHGVAGALLGKSVCDRPEDRLTRRGIIIGSVAPDLDMIGGWLSDDSLFQLEFHRGITHSFVGLPFFAVLLAGLTLQLSRPQPDRRRSFRHLAIAYAAGIALHILMDLITAYGTMIFQPLSMARYTFDMVFIIDLTLGSIVLIPQLVAWAWSDPFHARRRAATMWLLCGSGAIAAWFLVNAVGVLLPLHAIAIAVALFGVCFALPGLWTRLRSWPQSRYCQVGLVLMAIYLTACAYAHRLASERLKDAVARNQLPATRMAALPAPPYLAKWNGLVQTPDGITRFSIDLFGSPMAPMEFFANSAHIPYENALDQLPALQRYLWFARFPWVTAREQDGRLVVDYRDVQFMRPSNRGNSPFTFRAIIDAQGNVVSSGLLGR